MSQPHLFSLHRTSDQVAVLAIYAVGGLGLLVVIPTLAFLSWAAAIGLVFGFADWLNAFDRKWTRNIAVLVLVLSALVARDLFLPQLGLGARFLAAFQFIGLEFLAATIVVQLAMRAEARAKAG